MVIKEEYTDNDKFINEFQSRCYNIFSYIDDLETLDSGLSELWSAGFMEDYDLDKLSEKDKNDILKTLESCFTYMADVVDELIDVKAVLDNTRE